MTWETFKRDVEDAGLEAKWCGVHSRGDPGTHWQIQGHRLVNCWPHTKRGFVVQTAGGKGYVSNAQRAISLATKLHPKNSRQRHKYPPHVPTIPPAVAADAPFGEEEEDHIPRQRETRVGLIRWLWRFIW